MKNLYNKNKSDLLKFKFKNYERIDQNFSQAYQDIFILTMLNGKERGTFLEIGADDAIDNNNTYLLEKEFNWTGTSIDIKDSSKRSFEENRKNNFILNNALLINYEEILNKLAIDNRIDYLQLDIEPQKNTFECLKILPTDKFKFSVITFETDVYAGCEKIRDESREYFKSIGYLKIVGNICPGYVIWPFEDWYVDPDAVDIDLIKKFQKDEDFNDIAEKFIFNI